MVGPGQPVFVIAEAGVNHNGDLALAKKLVDAAVAARADAVKFQTFKAEKLISSHAPKAAYQQETTGAEESQLAMVKRLEMPYAAFRELYDYCRRQGILFMSTPFDEESADFLAGLGMAVFKAPSGEVTNLPFLAHVAAKGRPLILSTGMSYLGEVETAVRIIEATGNNDLVLLHCVSNYPADPADANLRAMQTLAAAFDRPVGYSDHTLGTEVALAAVALGACVIEKHFTLDRELPGPDHRASLEPEELAAMVRGIRIVERALGHGRKEPTASEANTADVARRSLVAAGDIAAGAVLTEEMIAIKRPGTGLPPAMRPYLVGRRARVAIPAGTLLTLDVIA
ncbi:MAG: N-acetylneuraminate synthase [Chloroflexi bacterium]|nr:N-acetylneuraminate synthase [Chloroflexota bacterium]MCI0727421.1 N-acetylneuraminate synthase [Chloroflexota bacterium]